MSEFVRERAVATLGLDPERIRVIPLGLDHQLLRPGGSGTGSSTTRRGAGRTRTMRRCSPPSPSCAASARTCGWCSPAAATFGDVPAGVEVRGHVPYAEVVRLLPDAPPRSSSRRCTRVSDCRRSRRWPAVARSRARMPGALPEVVGDAAALFDPRRDPHAIAAAVRRCSTPPTVGCGGGSRAQRPSRGRRPHAVTTPSTGS